MGVEPPLSLVGELKDPISHRAFPGLPLLGDSVPGPPTPTERSSSAGSASAETFSRSLLEGSKQNSLESGDSPQIVYSTSHSTTAEPKQYSLFPNQSL